ncbi:MAG: DUF763 domain-containing protein [Aquificota bacterium]|nr:DUF763 domain-containing protein [Aquificota bacterium]MDQ7083365.1 DUF763 domain-containing protein [Aquificota bacterium]
MRRGFADLPLHHGKAPPWLFERMVKLSRSVVELIVLEHGKDKLLEWLSDPVWFQSLGCVLGFDWHSSGLTTTVCGAIKEALKDIGREVGVFAVGGKGRSALKTPEELARIGDLTGIDTEPLVEVSRKVAKVDNALIQDGYQIYHHTLFFTEEGLWAVIQQGMNEKTRYARIYHWFSASVGSFVEEPHKGIISSKVHGRIDLNLTAKESEGSRKAIACLLRDRELTVKEIEGVKILKLPERHHIKPEDLDLKGLRESLRKMEADIKDFEDILKVRGLGPKTLRALALVAEIVYGAEPSFRDPARYSFAHGGKDGHPYPVRREIYDITLETLKRAIERAKIGEREKVEAVKRLAKILTG